MPRVVVLHVAYSVKASYYQDWVDAFLDHPHCQAVAFNLFHRIDRQALRQEIRNADLAVILHSGTGDSLDYVSRVTNELLERTCPLVVFMGNEFNMPWFTFAERRSWLKRIRTEYVATQLLEATGHWLYDGVGATVLGIPHGLNPRVFQISKPRNVRTIDIGSRSFPYPVYLGNRLRNDLFERVQRAGPAIGLSIDLSTTNRLDRTAWAAFLNDCRFTTATEAGSSHLQRDDELAAKIRAYIDARRKGWAIRPTSAIRGLARHIPWSVRERLYRLLRRVGIQHEALEDNLALHDEIFRRFYADLPPSIHHGGCISSRHFDAMGCGTPQLLVEGRYNDIIEPGRHYIAIRNDFSNLDEVLEQAADPKFGDEVAEAAFAVAHDRHTLQHRVSAVLNVIAASG